MLSSLKLKNFRIYWFGMIVSLMGTWMQQMAQSWLVFDLTKSAFYLGLIGFFSWAPVLVFSIIGGIFADKYSKRNLLIVTQVLFMTLAFILGFLAQTKSINIGHIIIISLLSGLVMAFDSPTRQSIVIELTGKDHLLNAVALNSVAFNSARIIGPALAGLSLGIIGVAGCFYINALSFLAVIFALFFISPLKSIPNNNTLTTNLRGIKSFIQENKLIKDLISIVGIASLFGTGYIILMPVFAIEVLKSDAKGLGILMSCNGIGALLGAVMLAAFSNLKIKGKILMISMLVFSLFLFLFGLSQNFYLSCLFLIILGFSSVTATSLINMLLQLNSPDEMRGRVLSVFMSVFAGFLPFGNLFSGTIAHFFNARLSVIFGAVLCFVFFGVLILSNKRLYKLI